LCDGSRFRCSLSQDIEHVFRAASINRAPLSDRCKQPLQYDFEPPFYCNVAETSTAITRFQFGDLCFVLTEGIEISEDHVAFDGPGVARAEMVRVCVHPGGQQGGYQGNQGYPGGQQGNQTGCPNGQQFDPRQNRCVTAAAAMPSCPTGQQFDQSQNRCVYTLPGGVTVPGQLPGQLLGR
jgi:hypothetical protein